MIFIKNDVIYGKVFKLDQKEKYKSGLLSTGDKQQDGSYKNSSWSCRFVGKANEIKLAEGDRIKITLAKIENIYDAENKKNWLNIIVFDFSVQDGLKSIVDNDELPF